MAKLKFELNRAGVRDFMRSPEMMKVCQGVTNPTPTRGKTASMSPSAPPLYGRGAKISKIILF